MADLPIDQSRPGRNGFDAAIRQYLSGNLDLGIELASEGRHRTVRISDNDLAPTLEEGDWVTVDLDDREPSPPGLFFLWDDSRGFVVRRVHVDMRHRRALVLEIWRSSPKEAVSVPRSEVNIEGRVIGVWKPL